MYAYLKFKPKLFISEYKVFYKETEKNPHIPHCSQIVICFFVGFAYMFKRNLKNARNKFANLILKTEFMITQFNVSNLITPYYNQCCIENKLFKITFSKLSL